MFPENTARFNCAEMGVVLTDYSTYGTFINEDPVNMKTILSLGQIIRVGTPGETLKLIACKDRPADET